MGATPYFNGVVLEAALANKPIPFAAVYVGLSATSDMSGEVTAPEYSRMPVSFGEFDTSIKNTNELVWVPESQWGSIKYVLICDSSQGGNVLLYDYVTETAVSASTRMRIPVDNLYVS